MGKKNEDIFSNELKKLFSLEEQEAVMQLPLPQLVEEYCKRSLRNSIEVKKQLVGDYDFSVTGIRYFKSFYPTPQAQCSWLYLQSLLDASFGPSYYTRRKNLTSWLLLQTTEGEGLLQYEGKEYRLLPGDVFLLDCRRLHDYRTAGNQWGYRLAHFDGNAMPDYYSPILSSGNVLFHFPADSEFDHLFQRLYQENLTDTEESELLTNCILTQLLTELLRMLPRYDHVSYPERIREMCTWLTENCCEPLTIEQVAAHFSISKYHLCREFHKHTGTTVFAYIENGRLNAARQLLRYSDLPIAAVAECVGYPDQSNFGRVFRRAEGISPSAYRKRWNGI